MLQQNKTHQQKKSFIYSARGLRPQQQENQGIYGNITKSSSNFTGKFSRPLTAGVFPSMK